MKKRTAAALPGLLLCLILLGCGFTPPLLAPISISHTNDVVFLGDSITEIWGSYAVFQAHTDWINKGIYGQSSFQVAERFQADVIALRPKAVHIIVGTNDVYPGWQPCAAPSYAVPLAGDTCANIAYMVQTARRYGIRAVLGTIPPWGCPTDPHDCGEAVADETASRYTRIATLNSFIEAYGKQQGIAVVDYHAVLQDATGLYYGPYMTADGVHPSYLAYALMTPLAAAAVE